VWGNAIALSLAWVQHKWHVVELSAEGYMLNYLPVEVEWWSVVALNAGVIAITLAMMLLPSQLISRISPAESLKYKQ
jgi:lipoprotein-releasing system permease protein